ncbi:MAG: hypothetical protein P8Y38_02965 [Deltaproteobacteria bacterium]|jgi:hypothetical protein
MLIFDDIFAWEGFGGKLKLGSGKCRLRIFDLNKGDQKDIAHLRPIIVVASDLPGEKMSVRSCSSHIATTVVNRFNIAPHRIQFVEYYPQTQYGEAGNRKVIPEMLEAVEFVWKDNKALHPKLKPLGPPLLDLLKNRIHQE